MMDLIHGNNSFKMFLVLILSFLPFNVISTLPETKATVIVSYVDPMSGLLKEVVIGGLFGHKKRGIPELGILAHVLSGPDNSTSNDACSPHFSHVIPKERWVALIERGNCKFTLKIINAVKHNNASAVIVYNNDEGRNNLIPMIHQVDDVTAVLIGAVNGRKLARLVDSGVHVYVDIMVSSSGKALDNRYPLLAILSAYIVRILPVALSRK